MGIDVRGMLKNATKRQMGALFMNEDGSKVSAAEAREHLLDELQSGHAKIPMGECDNWNYKTGCQGHPAPTPQKGAPAA